MNEKDLENLLSGTLTKINGEDFIIFEAPVIEAPEFRLYYDENGKVITYTCEKLEGNYIVVDNLTFAEARPDVRVINGILSKVNPNMIIYKLKPDLIEGVRCAKEDVSVLVDDTYENYTLWKITTHEL